MEEIKYSPLEEFANAFSHAIGTLLSIYGLVILVVTSNTPTETASTAIYGATMFILFQSSTCYHAMVNETAKKVFRKIDHSAIFLLIAGTYTPILLLVVPFHHSVALLAGGVAFSFGCIFYLLKKIPFMHSIWHLFVLVGAILHYFAVLALLK